MISKIKQACHSLEAQLDGFTDEASRLQATMTTLRLSRLQRGRCESFQREIRELAEAMGDTMKDFSQRLRSLENILLEMSDAEKFRGED